MVKLENILKGAVLIGALTIGQNAYADLSFKTCQKSWNRNTALLQKAEKNMNKGFDVIHSKPDTAFNYLNKADSAASTYGGDFESLYYKCNETTTMSKSEAKRLDDVWDYIEERSTCGMKVTPFIKQVHKLDDAIDTYNSSIDKNYTRDTIQKDAISAHTIAESALKKLNTIVNYTHSCDAHGDIVDFVNGYKKNLKENESFFERMIEKL